MAPLSVPKPRFLFFWENKLLLQSGFPASPTCTDFRVAQERLLIDKVFCGAQKLATLPNAKITIVLMMNNHIQQCFCSPLECSEGFVYILSVGLATTL